MNTEILNRLQLLREKMKQEGIAYWYIPTSDYHNSEYAADYFKEREFFCNFSGSNGSLLVGASEAYLWTDGRYWIQAAAQLSGTGVELCKMLEPGVPTVEEFLAEHLCKGDVLAFDGRVVTKNGGEAFEKICRECGADIRTDLDPADEIWTDRPDRPCEPLFVLQEKYAGKSFEDKLSDLAAVLKNRHADYYVSGKLDELMWLTNLRGNDVACNPVALCYGIFSAEESILFLQKQAVNAEAAAYLAAHGIRTEAYDTFFMYLREQHIHGKVMFDPSNSSFEMYRALSEGCGAANLVSADSPLELPKAVKNDVEVKNIREIYAEDSAAVIKLHRWLLEEAEIENLTEVDVADQLEMFRRQIHDFIELSFTTISAYGANAAMMHYAPTREKCAKLRREGMLLMDSGGTYFRGTTDITRTVALGPVTEEMRKMYTLSVAGNLRLQNAVFMEGCTGRNLDILARGPLWDIGSDYKCGTGHGIGFALNVHEGPQNIRWRATKGSDKAALLPGMIVSDEPGVYRDGEYGIRVETILLCVPAMKNADGQFFAFEPITFVPFDRNLLAPEYLTDREIRWVNAYHAMCYEKTAPYLTEVEREYLARECSPML